ncbi:FkbM family methyltransferase [Candidatus Woesebacteria bacterium]|nr:FkbM family methyltransferase [Candidatus Woesebacteria bacterium]
MKLNILIDKIWSASPKSLYTKLRSFATGALAKSGSAGSAQSALVTIRSGFAKGLHMYMPVPTPPTYEVMVEGTYEHYITEKIVEKMQPGGKVIWDIGAHIGYQTLAFANIVGDQGKVVAFEPNLNNIAWLTKNIDRNPALKNRIIVRSEAVSDKTEQLTFNISKNTDDATTSGGYIANVTPPLPDSSYEQFSTVTVQATSIDELLAQGELPVPDLLKIDVEGAEYSVVIGAKNTLTTLKPKLIIEIHTIPMMLYVSDFLKSIGYAIEILDEKDNSIFTKVIYAEYQS